MKDMPYMPYLLGYAVMIGMVLAIGFTFGEISARCPETYEGMCYFEVYDEDFQGMRIKVYNFSQEGPSYMSDCEGLQQMCGRQSNDEDDFFSTNFECEWIVDEDLRESVCECIHPKLRKALKNASELALGGYKTKSE